MYGKKRKLKIFLNSKPVEPPLVEYEKKKPFIDSLIILEVSNGNSITCLFVLEGIKILLVIGKTM